MPLFVLQMPPKGRMRFSCKKGSHDTRATSLPCGHASSGAASSSSGGKRARPAKPTVVRVALDNAAARSVAEQRTAAAAVRRQRAQRRAAADAAAVPHGIVTPPSSVSRNTSVEMSSGGSGPVQKRQAVNPDGVDMEEHYEASSEAALVTQARYIAWKGV